MGHYRKKPVEVEALPFDGTEASAVGIVAWAGSNGNTGISYRPFRVGGNGQEFALEVTTKEGTMLGTPGDFIIKGTENEFYPCKPEAFWGTYEPVEG